MKHYDLVGAVIVESGLVLCARRPMGGALGGMWEFPGGKIEPGETPQRALEREIVEELGCHVAVGAPLVSTRHEYEFGVVRLQTFYCEVVAGIPMVTEHSEIRWVAPSGLDELVWAPADILTVEKIKRGLPRR